MNGMPEKPVFYDPDDEQDRREQEAEKRRQRALLDAQDFESIATLPAGRRLLKRMMVECGIYQSTFTGDALTSAYQEGKRTMGLWLIEQFNQCPDLYIQLIKEKEPEDGRNTHNTD